jgi:hypothetical protein
MNRRLSLVASPPPVDFEQAAVRLSPGQSGDKRDDISAYALQIG